MKTEYYGFHKEKEGIIINKDNEGLQAYKLAKLKNKRVDMLEEKVTSLKQDITDIKEMLLKLMDK